MVKHEFDEYLEAGFKFQGLMNGLANSIDLMLGFILENLGIQPYRMMLGKKIGKFKFEKSKAFLADKYTGDFDKLIEKLQEFNENWIITKHGMIVGGHKDLTFHKDGKLHTFDLKRQEEIDREFTEIMKALTEIWNSLP